MIYVQNWRFYPEYMIAQHVANGNLLRLAPTNSGWQGHIINAPCQEDVTAFANWFARWISGGQP